MGEEEINVEIVLNNDTKVIMTSVERILPSNDEQPKLETQLHTVALVLVLLGNSYVVKRILANSKTFLDMLVVADSFLCLGEIGKCSYETIQLFKFKMLANGAIRNLSSENCHVIFGIIYFVYITNRMISLAIVAYRFIYVVMWRWVQSPRQQRTLNIIITAVVVMVSGALTSGVFYNRENYLMFLGKASQAIN